MMRLAGAALIAATAVLPIDHARAAGPSGQYRDWRLECVKEQKSGGGTTQTCLIQHEARRKSGGGAAMIARVRFLSKQPMLLFLLPPGLALKTAVSYTVDTGATATTEIKECNKQVCWAVVPVGEYLLASLKAGRKLSVATRALPGGIDIPLTGFTAAYNRLQQLER